MKRDEFIQQLQANQEQDIEIVKDKNQDYADGADPFQNFRMVEDGGLTSLEKGIVVRMSDKMQRVFNLLDEDAAVDDESVADTLSDLRNYANILQVYLEKDSNAEDEELPACRHECDKTKGDDICGEPVQVFICTRNPSHDGKHIACGAANDHEMAVEEQ